MVPFFVAILLLLIPISSSFSANRPQNLMLEMTENQKHVPSVLLAPLTSYIHVRTRLRRQTQNQARLPICPQGSSDQSICDCSGNGPDLKVTCNTDYIPQMRSDLEPINYLRFCKDGLTFRYTRLSRDNFTNFPFTQKIILMKCGIESIEPYTFSQIQGLQSLDLRENKIHSIPDYAFSSLTLIILTLSGNQPLQVGVESFKELKVERLYLEDTDFHDSAHIYNAIAPLLGYQNFTKLFLSKNNFTSFDPRFLNVIEHFSKIKEGSLEIYDNQFRCDCSLLWLSRSVRVDGTVFGEATRPKCTYPKSALGQADQTQTNGAEVLVETLSEYDALQLGCAAPSISGAKVKIEGDSWQVLLRLEGNPAPTKVGAIPKSYLRNNQESSTQVSRFENRPQNVSTQNSYLDRSSLSSSQLQQLALSVSSSNTVINNVTQIMDAQGRSTYVVDIKLLLKPNDQNSSPDYIIFAENILGTLRFDLELNVPYFMYAQNYIKWREPSSEYFSIQTTLSPFLSSILRNTTLPSSSGPITQKSENGSVGAVLWQASSPQTSPPTVLETGLGEKTFTLTELLIAVLITAVATSALCFSLAALCMSSRPLCPCLKSIITKKSAISSSYASPVLQATGLDSSRRRSNSNNTNFRMGALSNSSSNGLGLGRSKSHNHESKIDAEEESEGLMRANGSFQFQMTDSPPSRETNQNSSSMGSAGSQAQTNASPRVHRGISMGNMGHIEATPAYENVVPIQQMGLVARGKKSIPGSTNLLASQLLLVNPDARSMVGIAQGAGYEGQESPCKAQHYAQNQQQPSSSALESFVLSSTSNLLQQTTPDQQNSGIYGPAVYLPLNSIESDNLLVPTSSILFLPQGQGQGQGHAQLSTNNNQTTLSSGTMGRPRSTISSCTSNPYMTLPHPQGDRSPTRLPLGTMSSSGASRDQDQLISVPNMQFQNAVIMQNPQTGQAHAITLPYAITHDTLNRPALLQLQFPPPPQDPPNGMPGLQYAQGYAQGQGQPLIATLLNAARTTNLNGPVQMQRPSQTNLMRTGSRQLQLAPGSAIALQDLSNLNTGGIDLSNMVPIQMQEMQLDNQNQSTLIMSAPSPQLKGTRKSQQNLSPVPMHKQSLGQPQILHSQTQMRPILNGPGLQNGTASTGNMFLNSTRSSFSSTANSRPRLISLANLNGYDQRAPLSSGESDGNGLLKMSAARYSGGPLPDRIMSASGTSAGSGMNTSTLGEGVYMTPGQMGELGEGTDS